jgi:hypothetical protein
VKLKESMTTGQLRLQLELELDRDPIEGRLYDEHGQAVPFIGWLELMALVERSLVGTSDRMPDEGEPAG